MSFEKEKKVVLNNISEIIDEEKDLDINLFPFMMFDVEVMSGNGLSGNGLSGNGISGNGLNL